MAAASASYFFVLVLLICCRSSNIRAAFALSTPAFNSSATVVFFRSVISSSISLFSQVISCCTDFGLSRPEISRASSITRACSASPMAIALSTRSVSTPTPVMFASTVNSQMICSRAGIGHFFSRRSISRSVSTSCTQ